MNENGIEGFLLINKPSGVTSRYCVTRIVNVLKQTSDQRIKVGHAGTLDLFAEGLLIVGIARIATREIKHLITLDKRYTAKGKLGQLTDTLDYTGQVLQDQNDVSGITRAQLQASIDSFGTTYEQMPPLYSALKHNGKRLSALARSKKMSVEQLQDVAEKKRRLVQLYSLELVDFDLPFFTIAAHVSHGTYMRTLVDDIAQKVGTHATTHALTRTAIGPFRLDQAHVLNDLETVSSIEKYLIFIDEMLQTINNYSVGV